MKIERDILGGLFISALILTALWCLILSPRWESKYILQQSSLVMDLGRAPIWKAPHSSTYADFQQHFRDSGVTKAAGGSIVTQMNWSWNWGDITLAWLVAGIVFVLLDILLHRRLNITPQGHLSIFSRRFTTCMIIAASIACVLWIAFGGWGPPEPGWFAFLGAIGGLIWGIVAARKYNQGRTNTSSVQ